MQIIPITYKNYFSRLTNSLLLIFILSIAFNQELKAQGQTCKEELFPLQDENRKTGYVNAFGEWKVIPFYTKAFPFRGKVAIVLMGIQYGVINCEGNVVFKPQFQDINEYSGGVTWAKKDDKWGLISDTGSVITDFKYTQINEVGSYTYVTWVMKDLKWQLLTNFSGTPLNIDFFDEVKVLNFQTSLVKKELLIGLLNNETGKYLIQPEFQKVFKIAPNVFTAIKNEQWFLYSDEGKQITTTYYDSISVLGKFRLLVKKNGKYGILDYAGKTIVPLKFDVIKEPSNAHFLAQQDGKYSYFNIYGNKVKDGFQYAEPFYDGVALVKDNSYKILNLYTKTVHNLSEYDSVYRQAKTNNFVGIKATESYLLNTKGEKTLSKSYKSIYLNNSSSWIYLTNSEGCHYYNTKNNQSSKYFTNCSNYNTGYATAEKNSIWIILDEEGNNLPFQLNNKPLFLMLNGKMYASVIEEEQLTLLNLQQKQVIKQVDGHSVYVTGNYIAVKEKGEFKLLNEKGEEVLKPKYDTIITTTAFEWPKIISYKELYYLISKEGDFLNSKGFQEIQYFVDHLLKVKQKNFYGLINSKGEELIPAAYQGLGNYSEYFLSAQKDGKWGYINLKNQIRIPFLFSEVSSFKDQLAVVKTANGTYQIINKRGEVLEEGYSNFFINEEENRELRNQQYILKIKEGKRIKSYNYTQN